MTKGPCLVTGATGLIGSHLVPSLARSREVFALSRRATGKDGVPIKVDLASDWTRDALPAHVDAVVHLAQSEHFRDFPERAGSIFDVNALATARLLDYARLAGASTFVLASSGGVYGHGERPFSEEDPIATRGEHGFYAATKLCAELVSGAYSGLLRVIVLRFFFVYGPGQNETMLIPRLARTVREGSPVALHGTDGFRLNPIHVSDAVRAIERGLELTASAVVNVAGPEVLTLRQVGLAIGRSLGREPRFEVDAVTRPRHLIGDIGRMSALLGAPTVRFEDGVRSLAR